MLTAGVTASFLLGYYSIGLSIDVSLARSLAMPIDDRIPFVAASIYVYAWTYTAMLFPLFVVRSPRLFDRTALAYCLVIAVALPFFAWFPVSAASLREPVAALDPSRFHDWGVLLNYHLDPPVNLFPSVHLAIVTVAAGAAWKARRLYGAVATAFVAAIAVSVCTVKQHFAVDALAGLALGLVAYALLLHPYRPQPGDGPVAFGWRGPALYLAFHGSVYAALYLVFRSGWLPG